jgi:chemotaxis protein CheX
MASKTVEPGAVVPRSVWLSVLQETVAEVLSIMAGVTAEFRCTTPVEAAQVTAIVGIAGAIRANLVIRCSQETSITLVSQMLGVSSDSPHSQKSANDALGEICNVVAGYFKAKVGLGEACALSVPTIIAGRDYMFHSAGSYEQLELPVSFQGETLHLTLEIAQ